mmetsp:Transcript_26391/g.23323  ORF Transcript_26391/g.23323 Transcript_26391/m.23323 type:complete len:123 (+) Transcript_26391:197-565(+)
MAEKHGDYWYTYKKRFNENPKIPFFVSNLGGNPLIFLTDPDLIKEFVHSQNIFHKQRDSLGLFLDMAEGSFAFMEDEEWKSGRKLLSHSFHFSSLEYIIPAIIESSNKKFDELIKSGDFKSV